MKADKQNEALPSDFTFFLALPATQLMLASLRGLAFEECI